VPRRALAVPPARRVLSPTSETKEVAMTLPRQVVPDRTYLFTRRCLERRLFMTPKERDGVAKRSYLYCLALAAFEHGLEIHAFCCLGNHHHAVVTDFLAEVPDFAKQFHTNLARGMNKELRRGGPFWDATVSYSAVHLVDAEAVLDKIVYTILNPVAARLVERPEEWPGAISLIAQIASGEEIVVQRPKFFRARIDRKRDANPKTARDRARLRQKEKGVLPDEMRFRLAVPPQFKHLERKEFAKLLAERLAFRLAELRQERGKRKVLGVKEIFRQHWNEAPKPEEPTGDLNPQIACRDKWKRIERKQCQASFLHEHHLCIVAYFRKGKRRTRFPPGTYAAVRMWGARAAAA
jgi:putative transposase